MRDVVELAVGHRARVPPRAEHRIPGPAQLLVRVLGETGPRLIAHDFLEATNRVLQVRLGQVDVRLDLALALHHVQLVLERVLVNAEHHVAVHLDEAAIRIVSEATVARLGGQAAHGVIVETQVQNRVHHSRHGELGAAADRDEHRVRRVAELLAHQLLEPLQGRFDLLVDLRRELAAPLPEQVARVRRDGKARRDRQPSVRHLGQAGALATECVPHVTVAVGAAATKEEDVFSQVSLQVERYQRCDKRV